MFDADDEGNEYYVYDLNDYDGERNCGGDAVLCYKNTMLLADYCSSLNGAGAGYYELCDAARERTGIYDVNEGADLVYLLTRI